MSRRLTLRQRRSIASHEAGHAVAYLVLGKKFNFASVEDSHNNEYMGTLDFTGVTGDIWTLDELGTASMAGLAGERIAVSRPCGRLTEKAYNDGAYFDFAYIVNLYVGADICEGLETDWKETPYFAKKFVNDSLWEAYTLLTKHRDLHTRLTDALIEHGRLTFDQCREIQDQVATESVAAAAASAGAA